MNSKYRFMLDEEPTDSDLEDLMHQVAVRAKEKALSSEAGLRNDVLIQINTAFAREGILSQ